MRITRETLLKIARDTSAERVRVNRRIVCIYLTGSLLYEEPLLGGTGDIDLFIIHDSQPTAEREVVRLSDEIHLDIAHLSQDAFLHPRQLRTHPWISPFIVSHPQVYHDSQHWFEFAQAAITSQFNQPDNVVQRGRQLAEAARRSWLDTSADPRLEPAQVWYFLKALEDAANAIASLAGSPLTERRFWLEFPARTLTLGRPALSESLLELLAPQPVSDEDWQAWQPAWKDILATAGLAPDCPPRLLPARQQYYLRAAGKLRETNPAAALWILLRTWTRAACLLADRPTTAWESSPHRPVWLAALQTLGLDEAGFAGRLEALDGYLDAVEETLDDYAGQMGV